MLTRVARAVRWRRQRAARNVLERLPPRWSGHRWLRKEGLSAHLDRRRAWDSAEVVHQAAIAVNPLPCNIGSPAELPADAGWWGYSFRDVPCRRSGPTIMATIPDCTVVWYRDPEQDHDFFPAIIPGGNRALDLREVRFRPRHAEVLRAAGPVVELERATWILERVYHNHSHWLTAHVPKLILLQQRGRLHDVILPSRRTPTIDATLQMLGLDPLQFPTFDEDQPLHVGELTVFETDRFRPELLRLVQATFAPPTWGSGRRVYISRAGAARRRLVNEDELWPRLAALGFERVLMERLSFDEQVELMRATSVLVAPHGAGLTNMIFCQEGTDIVELADLSFPNPNFYALASAVGHRYWLVPAEPLGDDVHPLERDLRVEPAAVQRVLDGILSL